MKCQLARGLSISEVLAQDRFSGYSDAESEVLLQLCNNGWSAWRPEENQQVLQLQEQEGDDWAQITSKVGGKWRSRDEVKARFQFLRNQSDEQLRKWTGPHRWSVAENKMLKRKLAQGMTYKDVAEKELGLYGLKADNIREHAKYINAAWTQEDDKKLCNMNLEPHAALDWNYVGRQWNPNRRSKLVEKRWKFLQRHNRGPDIENDDEDEEIEDEDVGVESQSSRDSDAEVQQDPQEWRSWKEKEVRTLEAWRARNPNSWKGIRCLLPGRSSNACEQKWRDLHGVKGPKNKEWGDEEFTALKEWVAGHDHWPKKGQVIDRLPLRDRNGCKYKWRRHGKSWTDEENHYLISLQVREDMDWNEVAANASMQRGRSGREAKIHHGYLDDCRARGKEIKSLRGGLRRE